MELTEFFQQHPRVAIGFSGGVDSSYLLYAAQQAGVNVKAYYVHSQLQPAYGLQNARRMIDHLRIPFRILTFDALSDELIVANTKDRCYYCKKAMFAFIQRVAKAEGYPVVLEGTNASDELTDRAGLRALSELSVLSPLLMCGITKDEIRRRSKEAGLFSWDMPAYACLSTRIPTGEPITEEKLRTTEKAEEILFSMGFRDFRIRILGDSAKIEVRREQQSRVLEMRAEILERLRPYYNMVLLDLEGRK